MIDCNDILLEIEIDQEWRILEFENIKLICDSLRKEELVQIILKYTIPMIYSHWEGYVVTSLRKVNRYLNSLQYTSNEFNIHLLTLSYERNLKALEQSLAYKSKLSNLDIIMNKLTEDVSFEEKIDVKSNLKYKVLEDLCFKFNLNIDNFKEYENKLERLMRIRNGIAHGETAYKFNQFEEIQEYIDLLLNLMNQFNCEINTFLTNKKYLKE